VPLTVAVKVNEEDVYKSTVFVAGSTVTPVTIGSTTDDSLLLSLLLPLGETAEQPANNKDAMTATNIFEILDINNPPISKNYFFLTYTPQFTMKIACAKAKSR
jgi:hypothetical protein